MSAQTRIAELARVVMEAMEPALHEIAAAKGMQAHIMKDMFPAGYSADLVIAVRFTPKRADRA